MNKASILMLLLACAGSMPAWAEPRDPSIGISTEEKARRLRGDLEGYSHEAYPDREQIEERRQQMRQRLRQRLQAADRDGNGALSRDEASQGAPGIARHFDRIDLNGDGVLTRDELQAARERMRELRRQERGQPE